METNILNSDVGEMLLPLSLKNLTAIKPGQYWYEDDTFSSQLIEGKKLKAIIVLVRYSDVYGDILTEKVCSEKDVSSFLAECQLKYSERVFLPTIYEHQFIGEQMKNINASIEGVPGADKWSGRYMTSSWYACYQSWVKIYPEASVSFAEKGSSQKLRPLIAHQLV